MSSLRELLKLLSHQRHVTIWKGRRFVRYHPNFLPSLVAGDIIGVQPMDVPPDPHATFKIVKKYSEKSNQS